MRGPCVSCQFWLPDEDGKQGQCHRNPPTVTAIPIMAKAPTNLTLVKGNQAQEQQQLVIQQFTCWPALKPDQGCGEYRPELLKAAEEIV